MPYEIMEDESPQENSIIGYGKEALRHGSRQASNIATLGIGIPGDVFSLINDYIANPTIEAFGGKSVPYEKTLIGKTLPTTETHRKNLENLTRDYLKPQNEIEKFVDDVIEDASSLTNPANLLKTGVKKGTKLLKNLFKSVGANFSGELAKQNTGSESTGLATKAGSLFVLSLIDKEAAAKQVGKLYRTAEANLPAGVRTDATSLLRNIDVLENSITKGRPLGNLSAPEAFVVRQGDKIKNLIVNGEIPVEQAIAQKRSLNKELATLYKEVPGGKEQKNVKNMAKQLNSFLNKTIDQYGATNNNFYKPYKDADKAFGTLAKSNFVSHWVGQNITQHPITSGLMHLFSPVATTAATAAVPYQVGKLFYRISKSPTLAKIYAKTTAAAAKEDTIAFNKYFKELDKSLQEEEAQDRYEFVD